MSNLFPHGNDEEEILDEAQHIPQDTYTKEYRKLTYAFFYLPCGYSWIG
ncbi:hypothetical protein [Bartonella quintana]|uniref:Uncharacterized protein n=2 Tax=Bartonella quintana TaxID=803 RepID=W3U0F1_BARQI|nr:hypothetical protein [Bartonella quintana]ETS12876.1 hypothetical protein Q651_00820 [Bartonella quintana BQ2-D70]ETS14702.1 hypothetical protein Q650_00089 [Bartonella quintana JK 73rel]ETS17135.1 hypothetical protein Q649_00090 [Bartonella quintana JK 73]ETS17230.1 hypothetical protein Q648_00947 [Bartonella quintana JK 12]ETS19428.1 hypothetical protein Q647_00089 [Bartonella quintana JK 7]